LLTSEEMSICHQRGNKERFAPGLMKDPVISWVYRTFI
jgi:hypothetical protein